MMSWYDAVERFRDRLNQHRDVEFVNATVGSSSESVFWILTAFVRGVVVTKNVRILGDARVPEVIDEAAVRFLRSLG
jgi:hypothetical protein